MMNQKKRLDVKRLRDRIHGCLLGVAIGDALGAPFEHLGPGPQKGMLEGTGGLITDFHRGQDFPAGAWRMIPG